jgi:hypothetical protein
MQFIFKECIACALYVMIVITETHQGIKSLFLLFRQFNFSPIEIGVRVNGVRHDMIVKQA